MVDYSLDANDQYDDAVQFGPSEDKTETVNINPGTSQASPDVARVRSEKASFGLADYLPKVSKDDWYTSIISGQENQSRSMAAASVNYADLQQRVNTLKTTGQIPPPNLTEPDSVVEKAYANRFMSPMTKVDGFSASSMYGDANQTNPEAVKAAANAGADIATKVQIVQKAAEDNNNVLNSMDSSVPEREAQWTANELKSADSAWKKYPLVAAGLFATLASSAINFPYDFLKSGATHVKQAMEGDPDLSIDDVIGDAVNSVMMGNTLDDIKFGTEHKAAIVKATADAVRASATVDGSRPVQTVMSAAHGNVKEAAVQQVVADVNAGDSPKAEHDRDLRSLTSYLRIDQEAVANNPGSYGQDIVNRIRDANDNFVTNLSDKMQNVMKVNRTPQAIAQEDVVRGEADRIKGTYQGLGNAIVDIQFDPAIDYNKVSNTYSTRTKIGTFDGEMFTTEKQAKLFAELHGIHIKEDAIPNNPVGGMNQGPFDYNKFTDFRTAAGNAGLRSKDLRDMGLGNSVDWFNAKNRLTAPDDNGALIKNQGSGFYIEKRTPFNENSEALLGDPKTGLGSTPDTRTPHSWWNSAFKGFLSSPPMALARGEMANRRVTAHTPSVMKEVASSEWKIINSIHKDSWSKFNQLLEAGRDLYDKDGNKGYFFESPGDIEDWHSLYFPQDGKPPGDLVEGYFAYKRLYNMDLALRNISAYRFASRLGTEQHQWTVRDKDNNKVKSGFIQGIRRSTIPAGDHGVLILGKTKDADQIVSAKKLGTTKLGQQTQDDVFSGRAHVVELWDPDRKELGTISSRSPGSRIRYVISHTPPETKPLDIGQMVPRRGGGHFDYDWEFGTAQPKIEHDPVTGKYNYTGDRIITLHKNPGEAKDFAKRMDVVRQYRNAGMYDEAKSIARDTLHMGEEQFNQWFGPREMPDGGKLPPYLSDEHTIRHVRRGKSTIDYDPEMRNKYGPAFRDATTSGSAAAQFKVQYTQARDAEQVFEARNKGNWSNPLWEYQPAKLLDPLPILGRAVNRIANSQAGDDMKIAAITHWLKAAEPHMDYGPNTHAIVWNTPWRVFNAADIKWRRTEENDDIIRGLEGDRQKIKTFSGAFNPNERFMHNVATKVAISLYDKWGPKSSIAPTWMLPKLSDPWRIARTIAVHPILGMFKPSAFGMQLSTFSNVMGIAGPKHGTAGFMGAMLHEFTRVNDHPNFIKHLDWMASSGPESWGWKPGEMSEAWHKFIDSGFFNVGTEHGYVDDPTSYNPIRSVGRTIADAGMTPFQEGAQFVRASSWFTAYHEYRNGGGGKFYDPESNWKGQSSGEISREGWEQILNRAGTLDHNMSRASTAPYQQGPGSIPFMFWAYKLRLTELMLSKQLNTAEKIRLFTTSTLMYGGIYGGAGLLGLPVGDYVRTGLLSGNWDVPFSQELGAPINLFHTTPYVTGHNFWLSAAIEGLPATFVAWLTGALDNNKSILDNLTDLNKHSFGEAMRNGNWYNIGEYFGNQSLVEDMMKDHSVMEMVAGAPGSFIGNAYKTAHKVGWDFYNWAVNHDRGTTLNDILEASRSINAINVAYQGITAIATHNWMTRTNTIMQSNVSAANALFMAGSGLHDQQALDAYDRRHIMTKLEEARNVGESHAKAEIHFMLDAYMNDDPEAAEAHKVQANSYLRAVEYPDEKFAKFYERSMDDYTKNVPEDINQKFFYRQGVKNPHFRYPKGVSDEQLDEAAKNFEEVDHNAVPPGTQADPKLSDTIKMINDAMGNKPKKTKVPKDPSAPPRSHHKQKD